MLLYKSSLLSYNSIQEHAMVIGQSIRKGHLVSGVSFSGTIGDTLANPLNSSAVSTACSSQEVVLDDNASHHFSS